MLAGDILGSKCRLNELADYLVSWSITWIFRLFIGCRGGSRIWKRRGRSGFGGSVLIFLANLGDFLKNLGQKGVGVRPLRPPPLWIRAWVVIILAGQYYTVVAVTRVRAAEDDSDKDV